MLPVVYSHVEFVDIVRSARAHAAVAVVGSLSIASVHRSGRRTKLKMSARALMCQ